MKDVIAASKTGVETLLAVKRALLKSESQTPKSAVHKKIQDVDKARVDVQTGNLPNITSQLFFGDDKFGADLNSCDFE